MNLSIPCTTTILLSNISGWVILNLLTKILTASKELLRLLPSIPAAVEELFMERQRDGDMEGRREGEGSERREENEMRPGRMYLERMRGTEHGAAEEVEKERQEEEREESEAAKVVDGPFQVEKLGESVSDGTAEARVWKPRCWRISSYSAIGDSDCSGAGCCDNEKRMPSSAAASLLTVEVRTARSG